MLASTTIPGSAAIIIDNYDTATNDRYQDADDPDQFFLNTYDLSGVGMDNNGRWATLIGPNTILSANHFKPSGTITFYPGNDPTATPVQIGLSSDSLRITNADGGTDLWIARLESFAPISLKVYNYAIDQISEPNSPVATTLYEGESAIMTGRSPADFGNTIDQAFGTNVISDFIENEPITISGSSYVIDTLRLSYDTGGSNYEAVVQPGDSGAPLLYDDGTDLIVLGVNTYVGTNNGNPVLSGISYTGNDADAITAQVDAWAAVPEPLAALPAGMAALVFIMVRRRRSQA